MTHLAVSEWGRVAIGEAGFSNEQASALVRAAQAHPLGGDEGSGIVSHRLTHLRAGQFVGVLAAEGCSLEILPKIESDAPIGEEEAPRLRGQLVRMLAVALDVDIGAGEAATMGHQRISLLDILIRLFADRLLAQTRRGLPRSYLGHEDDLPALRGKLDVVRQFTINAVRPDRLACRYDALSSDIPLLRAMKACVVFLGQHARVPETRRRHDELRFVLSDVRDVAPREIDWKEIIVDRTSRHWTDLLNLARMFLGRNWQAVHHDPSQIRGLSLLFPMNDLFEAYIAALLPRALAGAGLTVDAQGGRLFCLSDEEGGQRGLFQTRPDLIIRHASGAPALVLDTKWKRLTPRLEDAKQGVSQADVYQLMAYAQLYRCSELMLVYPHHRGLGMEPFNRQFLIRPSHEQRLRIVSVDLAQGEGSVVAQLRQLCAAALALAC